MSTRWKSVWRVWLTSYFRPFKKEDIQVELNEAEHTADLTIHFQEIGRQRVAFSGGREQFGSTLGIAYTVFNLLSWDEHLSAQIDGAPEVSRWPLGLRKKDFLAREPRWLSPSSTRSFVRVLRQACQALSSGHRRKESTSVGTIPFRMSMRSQSIMDFHAQSRNTLWLSPQV
jgi:hypothetical protein